MQNKSSLERHKELTLLRARAYEELLETKSSTFFPYHNFATRDQDNLIDILVYELDGIFVLITNGMSDCRMPASDEPDRILRAEIIQYFKSYQAEHARRLYDCAWLPHFDCFNLSPLDSIRWPESAIPGSKWKNSLLLQPILKVHQNFRIEIDGDETPLLWHVPISDEELDFKYEHGINRFLDLMDEKKLPVFFDENERVSLL